MKFYLVGKKGRVLKRFYPTDIVADHEMGGIKNVGFEHARAVADDVIARFLKGEFDVAHLFYSKFVSALVQEPTGIQIVPVPLPTAGKGSATDNGAVTEYEPNEETILADLLPRNVAIQVFRALLENAASEQGSRMNAMENATKNAGDMIKRLSIQYNRARQAAITTELVEIISGAEAL